MLLLHAFFALLYFYNVSSYSAIQPQVCNKLSVCFLFGSSIFRQPLRPREDEARYNLLRTCIIATWYCAGSILTMCATRFAGALAVLVVVILQIPELGTKDVGDALEWVFYVALPNFCFSKALQDLIRKYTLLKTCREVDGQIGLKAFCALMRSTNTPNPCCLGELQDDSSLTDL